MNFRISNAPLDPELLKKQLYNAHSGGYVSFEGWVRDHNEGKSVDFLEYEAFEALCNKEAEVILKEAVDRYEITQVDCVHRVGKLGIGEIAIWIGAAAAHRQEAFRACQYVIDEIKLRLPVWKKEHYTNGDAEWVNCQECYKHSHHYHCDKEEKEFYSWQTCLSDFGSKGQEQLCQSKALVVGAGGLGSPALMALAGAGVGTIKVVDGDRLEISNLARQNLYEFQDVGKQKAVLAEEALRKRNPFIRVESQTERVEYDNAQDILQGYNVVLDCTDNFKTKYLLHDVCQHLKIPLVQASLYKYEGEVEVFLPDKMRPCLRCHFPQIPEEGCTGNCHEVGVFGFTTNTVGSIQAQRAIEVLLNKESKPGKTFINLRDFNIFQIGSERNESCSFCSQKEYPLLENEFVDTSKEWDLSLLQAQELGLKWVDIREPSEREDDLLGDILQIPLSRSYAFDELDNRQRYLLICGKGVRSSLLAKELRSKRLGGFYSLEGGLEKNRLGVQLQ